MGVGRGEGATVNVPWWGPGVSDADFMAAFQLVLLPIAREFAPDVVGGRGGGGEWREEEEGVDGVCSQFSGRTTLSARSQKHTPSCYPPHLSTLNAGADLRWFRCC